MVVRWHEFLLKDIDSTFRRIEDEFSLKEKIDNAILTLDPKLADILRDVCNDFQNLVVSSDIEIVLVSNDELIPMGLSSLSSNRLELFAQLRDSLKLPEQSHAVIKDEHDKENSETLYCFPIFVFEKLFMLLLLGRDEKSQNALREEEFIRLTQLISNQLGVMITKCIEALRTRTQNALINLFFNKKLKPTTCWYEIVNQIGMFLPDWKPLLIEPPPKVQFLSYKQGDRHLRILATQGEEQIGTEVLVDSSISGMLVEDPSRDYVCVDPNQHLDRYGAFLLDGEKKIPHSELAVSIKNDGNIIGIINLEHPTKDVFKSQHIDSILAVAKFLAPFVDALKTRHEVQHTKELGILYTINHLLGRSASTYHHLLGQPLLQIRLTIEKIRKDIQKDGPIADVIPRIDLIEKQIDEIHKSSERFCQNLPSVMDYGPTNVQTTVEAALSVFNRDILKQDENITFSVHIEPNVKPVFASKLLQEHLFNLVNNSVFSLREARSQDRSRHGEVQISVCRKEIKDKLGRPTASTQVVFQIADNGTGASKEDESKIGQPGFTTKDKQGGSGYGVAAAIEYMQSLGGHLTVDNSPGQGFIVQFYLEEFEKGKHA